MLRYVVMSPRNIKLTAFVVVLLPIAALAQKNIPPEHEKFFEDRIRPALVKYCYECHSQETGKTKGGLLVDSRDALLQGGDSGPSIDQKQLSRSLLLDAVTWADRDYEMPPKEKMPANVIRDFETWIKMGAPDPRVREQIVVESKLDIEEGKTHWAYQPLRTTPGASIDRLVSAKLSKAGLKASPQAHSLTLLRRLNYDLIGLPPTAEEVRVFYNAYQRNRKAAIAQKVDELLARPQFGERWGRHWLDVARYAESSGTTANFSFPHAWRYRDYVIDAFNDDMPYNRFLTEQIAGDLLPYKDKREKAENIVATGFLAVGIKRLDERNPRQFMADMIDEQIAATSTAFLGLTVACARCHDHKTDAIPTTDYYAMAGIFFSTDTYYGTLAGLQNRRPSGLLVMPYADEFDITRSYSKQEVADMKKQLDGMRSDRREMMQSAMKGGERPDQRNVIQMRNQQSRIEGLLSTLDENGNPKVYCMGVQEGRQVGNSRVMLRGDVEKPAQQVPRGVLQVLGKAPRIPSDSSGRLELAQWMIKDNPLTPRVMANRVWLNLLGEGLVGSPNNFGVTGQPPSHPLLLDYLAKRFMDNGWSVKKLIREIVLSSTYQRGPDYNERNNRVDPDNTLLWRAHRKPLSAEALRDSMLLLGGNLDLSREKASAVARAGNARVGRRFTVDNASKLHTRRAMYLPVLRDEVPEALDLFDFADPNAMAGKREQTIVPEQSLYMMNNDFVLAQADLMAKRLLGTYPDTKTRVKWAFLMAYGRQASSGEVDGSVAFVRDMEQTLKKDAAPPPANWQEGVRDQVRDNFRRRMKEGLRRRGIAQPTEKPEDISHQALAAFCQALIASAEFRLLN
jgi:cytochrome c553